MVIDALMAIKKMGKRGPFPHFISKSTLFISKHTKPTEIKNDGFRLYRGLLHCTG
jgi:hypothetical protein